MPRIEGTKLHILQLRKELIDYCATLGLNNQEIGDVFFGANRSTIRSILKLGYKQLDIAKKRAQKAARAH